MSLLPHNPRRKAEEHSFHPVVYLLAPLLAIFFQVYLPLRFPSIALLDVPLLVVIYFSISHRSPVAGTFLGLIVGLIQDAMTHLPLGINGIIDCILGYFAASIGVRIDVDSTGTRLIANFLFILLASILHLLILRRLLGMHETWLWVHELIRALVNTLVGVILFAVLDRLRRRE